MGLGGSTGVGSRRPGCQAKGLTFCPVGDRCNRTVNRRVSKSSLLSKDPNLKSCRQVVPSLVIIFFSFI